MTDKTFAHVVYELRDQSGNLITSVRKPIIDNGRQITLTYSPPKPGIYKYIAYDPETGVTEHEYEIK